MTDRAALVQEARRHIAIERHAAESVAAQTGREDLPASCALIERLLAALVETEPAGIGLVELQRLNVERAKRWHTHGGLGEWSPLEWAGAMAGEAGEACNAAKKLKRLESDIANIDNRIVGGAESVERYSRDVAKEVADTIIYGVLLCARVGVDVESVVREVFNRKSEEYGFPERLPATPVTEDAQ
jgi:NTP pyrophosphatase (non-canonical NTP hydrolase)